MTKIRYLSLFSGIEAFSCAVKDMPEFEPVAFAEIEPFPCAVLQHHFPDVPNLGDVTQIDGKALRGEVDLIVGGSPCFVAGTMVLTPSGYRPIEDLQVGDEVVSGKGAIRRITAAGNRIAEVGRMTVGDGVGKTFDIVCTPNHPFLCFPKRGRDNDWVPAFDTVGRDVCHGPALKPHIASPVLSFTLEGFDVVYNITVEEDHDYIVNGLIVHNCQGFSVAGQRKGLNDERSCLALAYVRLVEEVRPKWILWENVPGVFSTNGGQDFRSFCAALDNLRYSLSWSVLDSQYWGVAQRRRRVFLVGVLGTDWERCAKVLLEPESMCGNPPPRRKKGEGNSGRAEGCAGERGEQGSVITPEADGGCATISAKWSKQAGGFAGDEYHNLVGEPEQNPTFATLCASGAGCDRPSAQGSQLDYCVMDSPKTYQIDRGSVSESDVSCTVDTTVRNGPMQMQVGMAIVEKEAKASCPAYAVHTAHTGANGIGITEEVAHTLDTAQPEAVAFAQNQRDEVRQMEVSGALSAESGMKQTTYIAQEGVYPIDTKSFHNDEGGRGLGLGAKDDPAFCLRTDHPPAVAFKKKPARCQTE